MMGITNIHQSKVEIQGKKSPTKNEKKNIERERERERTFFVWEKYA